MRCRTRTTLGFLAMMCLEATAIPNAGSWHPTTYELYSWQQPVGTWNFCILLNTSSEKTVLQVFSDKTRLRGVDAVEKKIAKLPGGSTVVWVTRLPTESRFPIAKGSELLASPPSDLVAEIHRFADARKIDLVSPQSGPSSSESGVGLKNGELRKLVRVKPCPAKSRSTPITSACVAAAIAEEAFLRHTDHKIDRYLITLLKGSGPPWVVVIEQGDDTHPGPDGGQWFIHIDPASGATDIDDGR